MDLTSAAGRADLEHAIGIAQALPESDPVRRTSQLRGALQTQYPTRGSIELSELAGAAMTQAELRHRGAAKFGDAAQAMYFTPDGLEQASRTEVAMHRASRFAASGLSDVLDLCCGIGGDLRAFTTAGLSATGVDSDRRTAQCAALNAPGATVLTGQAQDAAWSRAGSVFLDPARRAAAGRIFDPTGFSPPLDFVLQVLAGASSAAAKLAPGLPHQLVPADVEAEWVSFAGGVKETVLWSPAFTDGIRRRASVLTAQGSSAITDADEESFALGEIGEYLYEPDGAVIRAGLVRQVAALLPGGRRIDEHLAYLTCDATSAESPLPARLARGFRVLETLPYSLRTLRSALRRHHVGIVEIKKRGVDIDPAALRRELRPSGARSMTVLLARIGDHRTAILAVPLAAPLAAPPAAPLAAPW